MSRLDDREEWISRLDDRVVEIIQIEQKKKKKTSSIFKEDNLRAF